MTVYVVEQGCYSNAGVIGVYATPEAAMSDNPIPDRATINRNGTHERDGGWQIASYSEPNRIWTNGLDWDDHKSITAYEVQE